jgi:hypothetical protein
MRKVLDLLVWLIVIAAVSGAFYATTIRSHSDGAPCGYAFHDTNPKAACPFCRAGTSITP